MLKQYSLQVITWFQNRRAKLKRDLDELKADVTAATRDPEYHSDGSPSTRDVTAETGCSYKSAAGACETATRPTARATVEAFDESSVLSSVSLPMTMGKMTSSDDDNVVSSSTGCFETFAADHVNRQQRLQRGRVVRT